MSQLTSLFSLSLVLQIVVQSCSLSLLLDGMTQYFCNVAGLDLSVITDVDISVVVSSAALFEHHLPLVVSLDSVQYKCMY